MKTDRGAVTLFMSLIILLTLTVIALTGSKSARLEQLISANEYRALEVFHAAEAGLEYGIRWLAGNRPACTWVAGLCTYNVTMAAPAITASNGDTYNPSVTYTRTSANKDYTLVRVTAVSAQDATITASVQQYVRPNTMLTPGYLLNSPPLVIDGCVSGITGNPDVFPGGVGNVALLTSQPTTCVNTGHLDLHGGTVVGNAFTGTAWEFIFGSLTKAQFQALAAAEVAAVAAGQMAASDRRHYWITDSNPWHTSLGSGTHGVVLAFAAASNCPQTNGGVILHGVVYYEDPACGNQGWGGADIYGTVAFEGNLTKMNANVDVEKFTLTGSGAGLEETLPYTGAPRIVGTWKDF
ncbi:MAG: PilX N-terminal domain-containing pilus assembly protein [Magnetococcus sp. DMHC-8]